VFPYGERFADFEDRIHQFLDMKDALYLAHQLGTLHKDDRTKQYPLNTQQQIIDAVNLALTNVRRVERTKDEQITALTKKLKRANWKVAGLLGVLTSPGWIVFFLRILGR
jgi:hypothetical protein